MEPAERLPRDINLDEVTFEVLLRDSEAMAERETPRASPEHTHPAGWPPHVVIDVPDQTRDFVVGLGSYGA